ncbi:MFS general substrate transporter [Zopfia rhizophila CBS 207.26]|uniref:MFS general substrate transporter n=1 Tax=Zopfia rhizophila CBS 207.26 TaxID=1314779 RepID=A0A6A6E968_9PEZI|nr:MFS general substrate transporter [Zopfia rhizophila CBS 207.26]
MSEELRPRIPEENPRPSTTSSATVSEEPSKVPPATLFSFTALTLCIFLVALDTVLIPTALPTISKSFHIPDSLYAWTGSAYLLSNAASVPVWGKLSDIFGRKPVALVANFIFLVGSLVCAVAVSAGMLIAGRAVQGLGGGGVVILVHICVADMFALQDRSFYLGIVGAVWAIASALGPVLGGIFAQNLNWRWCFYVNLPIVSISIVILALTLHLPSPRTAFWTGLKAIDWLGSITICTGTLLLLIGLQLGGSSHPWTSPLTLLLLIFGALTYILFFFSQWWEDRKRGSPIMPLRIFRDMSNLSALGVCACDALVFNSVAYFLPLYFQLILLTSPSLSGIYMLALAIPLATVSLLAGYVMNRTGHYILILRSGLALMTLGVGLFISFPSTRDIVKVIGFLIVVGIGFGPNFHAPLIALQTRIRESDIAAGTSAFGFVRMVSGAIGVVVGQVVFQALMQGRLERFLDVGVDGDLARALAGGEAISQVERVGRLSGAQQGVVRGEMTGALKGTWIFYTGISALGLLVSFGIRREKLRRERGEADVEIKEGDEEEQR